MAREGSFARAAEVLHLAPQTISGQIRALESDVDAALFERKGRRLSLTPAGRLMMDYAEEIFSLGEELTARMRGDRSRVTVTLNIGIVNSIAKLISARIVSAAPDDELDIRISCWEGDLDRLVSDLASSRLDLVISDRALPAGASADAYNHELGESGIAFFAPASKASALAREFPRSLEDTPVLLPLHTSALRRRLDDWFRVNEIRPRIVAEFDDSALMKAYSIGAGSVFPAPLAIAREVEDMYGTRVIGEAEGLKETYYAISPERKITEPALERIVTRTRETLVRQPVAQ